MGTLERPAAEDLPAPAASRVLPELVRDYRLELTRGEDVLDPETFSGSIPQLREVAPRVRVGRDRWFNLLWLIPIGLVPGMKWRGGPRVVLLARRLALGIRCDCPEQGPSGNAYGQAVLAGWAASPC